MIAVGRKSAVDRLSVWAVRYALGRATYAVADVVDALIQERANVTDQSAAIICRDIDEAFERGNVGMDMDAAQWRRLRDVLTRQQKLHTALQELADDAIAHGFVE